MSLACVRFAAFPERCAPNGFLRKRADPGARRLSEHAPRLPLRAVSATPTIL
jgi:hypothetical protein